MERSVHCGYGGRDRRVAHGARRHIQTRPRPDARCSGLSVGFPAARQPRADRPDWHIENRGYLLVAHPLQSDEQDDRALLLRELGDRALQVTQLEPLTLLRRAAQHRLGFI